MGRARSTREIGEGTVRINTSLNIDLPVRFAAKVGLAAGYYVYGKKFSEFVSYHHLRQVMMIDPAKLESDDGKYMATAKSVKAFVDSYLHEVPSDDDWELLSLDGRRAIRSGDR